MRRREDAAVRAGPPTVKSLASSRLCLALLVAAMGGATLAITAPGTVRPWNFPDSYHYAEMGRQIVRGAGFSSQQAYPYLLSWLRERGHPVAPPWPNVTRFPLMTLIDAGAFRLLGTTPVATVVAGSGFFLATVVGSFLLGARLFGNVGGIAAALALSIDVVQVGIFQSGLPEGPAGFFLVASMLALVATLDEGERAPRVHVATPLCLGGLAGLAFLLRYDLLPLGVAAGLVVLVGRGDVGRRQLPWMILGFAVVVTPWVCRNLVSFGTPAAFLGIDRNLLWKAGGADPYASMQYGGLWSALAAKPSIVLDKLGDFLWPIVNWNQLFASPTRWLGPSFVAVGAYLLLRRHRALRPWLAVLVTFLLRTLILTVTHHERRFYQSYVPLLLVFVLGPAAELVASRAREPRLLRAAAAWLLVLLLLLPAARGVRLLRWSPLFNRPSPDTPHQPTAMGDLSTLHGLFATIQQRIPESGIVATVWTEAVAWYGERPAIGIRADQITAVEELGVRVAGLLYPTGSTELVRRQLARQGIGDDFVPVLSTPIATLWVHRKLLRDRHDPA